jgi:ParB-like nuclease domain
VEQSGQGLVAESTHEPHVEWLAIDAIVPNPSNPNEQDERTFNATVASIEEEGWLQPCASVVDLGNGTYEIVGGEHRWQAARVLGHETAPFWLLDPEKFGRDRRDWSLMKMNLIAGKTNPEKFARLYERMVQTYDAETLQALMGFTSQDAFAKVYKGVKDALPKELQDALEDVKGEIRTIDDLSLVLNRLFRDHGETLPSNMMVFSWAGKDVLWVRADDELWAMVKVLADEVTETSGDMTALLKERLRESESVPA